MAREVSRDGTMNGAARGKCGSRRRQEREDGDADDDDTAVVIQAM
jgi:hypothetical protein